MFVYRLTSKKFETDLSGIGSAMYGGRWNKKGTPVVYTGESHEIALLETIVHTPPLLVPSLVLVTLEIPDDSIEEITLEELPENWKHYPAPMILAETGDEWAKKRESLALKVPSCIVESSNIVVLNPRHERFKEVKIVQKDDFHFDPRLKA